MYNAKDLLQDLRSVIQILYSPIYGGTQTEKDRVQYVLSIIYINSIRSSKLEKIFTSLNT